MTRSDQTHSSVHSDRQSLGLIALLAIAGIGITADPGAAFVVSPAVSPSPLLAAPSTKPLTTVSEVLRMPTTSLPEHPSSHVDPIDEPLGQDWALAEYTTAIQAAAFVRDIFEEIEMTQFLNVRTIAGPLDEWIPRRSGTEAMSTNSSAGSSGARLPGAGPSEMTRRITPIARMGGTVRDVSDAFKGPSSETIEHQLEARDRQMGEQFQMPGVEVVASAADTSLTTQPRSPEDNWTNYLVPTQSQSVPSILLGLALVLGTAWLAKQAIRQLWLVNDV